MSDPWQDVLDSAPDAMLLVGPEGRIGMSNRQLEAMFGYDRGELLGRRIEVLVPERYRDDHKRHRAGFMGDPRKRLMGADLALFGVRKDGSELAVEISLSPIDHEVGKIVLVAVRDVTERRRAEEQSRALLDTAPDAMVIVDAEGTIVLVNQRLEAMFGYGRDDLLGQPVEVLVPERFSGHAARRETYAAAPTVRPMGQGEVLFGKRRDGSEFPVEISLAPVETDRGMLVSAAIRDSTERVETERRLRELDRLKDEFLSVVSHELRTPLTAIGGFAQLLLAQGERIDPAGRADMLGRIARNASEMDRLVGQLLDLSRLDAGQVEVTPVGLDLVDTVEACLASLADAVSGRVRVEVPAGTTVVADAHAVDRVLSNLLTNAVKFSPPDADVEVQAAPAKDGEVVVRVVDHGLGIPAAEREKVFERFYQVAGSSTGPRNGTGIGLSIVRRYIELLDGTVWVDDTPGGGSTFSFTLPSA